MKSFLVTDHLESDVTVLLVIVRLYDLPETTLAEHLEDLVAVRHVVVRHVQVRTGRVVVAIVVFVWASDISRLFLRICSDEIYLREMF